MITREQLLAATKRRFDEVVIPGLGAVRIRSLTEVERSEFEAEHLSVRQGCEALVEAKRVLIVMCLCDDDGNQLLELKDVDALAAVDGAITGQLFSHCQSWCGIGASDEELETILGNSGRTLSNDS